MLGKAVAFAVATTACLAGPAGRAQDEEAEAPATTAEAMIEVARETWSSPDMRRCPEPKPGEIVVCAPDPEAEDEEFGVESPTEEALRKGEAVRDSVLRAPDVFGLPPCSSYGFCSRMGGTPKPRLLIDLEALPHPLTPEEAALVFRAEDSPASPATTEAASPAAAP